MPQGLKRYYGQHHLHYLTCSCYHRQPWLATPRRRDLFSQILEETRRRYGFVVVGYVVMPDHIHLLISEPERGTPSTVMQVVKSKDYGRLRQKLTHLAAPRPPFPKNAKDGAPARVFTSGRRISRGQGSEVREILLSA
jgi:REP element-mobilizing transposase RayT